LKGLSETKCCSVFGPFGSDEWNEFFDLDTRPRERNAEVQLQHHEGGFHQEPAWISGQPARHVNTVFPEFWKVNIWRSSLLLSTAFNLMTFDLNFKNHGDCRDHKFSCMSIKMITAIIYVYKHIDITNIAFRAASSFIFIYNCKHFIAQSTIIIYWRIQR